MYFETTRGFLGQAFGAAADEEVVEGGTGWLVGEFREGAGFVGRLELGAQALVLGFVEGDVGVLEFRFFRACQFTGDQIVEIRQAEFLVERDEVGLDQAGAHEVDASEEDTVDVEEGFNAAWAFLVEEIPLGLGESKVVVGMMFGDAAVRDVPQLSVLRGGLDDERRVQLLQHIAIFLEQQFEELPNIVADDVHLQAFADA